MPNLSITGRAAVVVALIFSVIAGGAISAPAASAQSGSRLCGRIVAGSGSAHTLYLVEVDKDSKGWGEFDKDFQRCENAQQRWVDSQKCNYEKCYDYTKCEELSGAIGWSGYTGRVAGYNRNDICTSMKRGTLYKVGLSGTTKVTSFATA